MPLFSRGASTSTTTCSMRVLEGIDMSSTVQTLLPSRRELPVGMLDSAASGDAGPQEAILYNGSFQADDGGLAQTKSDVEAVFCNGSFQAEPQPPTPPASSEAAFCSDSFLALPAPPMPVPPVPKAGAEALPAPPMLVPPVPKTGAEVAAAASVASSACTRRRPNTARGPRRTTRNAPVAREEDSGTAENGSLQVVWAGAQAERSVGSSMTAWEVSKNFETIVCQEKKAFDARGRGFSRGSSPRRRSSSPQVPVHGRFSSPHKILQDWKSSLCTERHCDSSASEGGHPKFVIPRSRSSSLGGSLARERSLSQASSVTSQASGSTHGCRPATPDQRSRVSALFGAGAVNMSKSCNQQDPIIGGSSSPRSPRGLKLTEYVDAKGHMVHSWTERCPRGGSRRAPSEGRRRRTMQEVQDAAGRQHLCPREGARCSGASTAGSRSESLRALTSSTRPSVARIRVDATGAQQLFLDEKGRREDSRQRDRQAVWH